MIALFPPEGDDDRQRADEQYVLDEIREARLRVLAYGNRILLRAMESIEHGDTAPQCLTCGGNAETCRHSVIR